MLTLTEPQRAALTALVDTFVPSVVRDDDPHGYWARPGTAVQAHVWAEAVLAETMPDSDAPGLGQLLDALGALGIHHQPQPVRETIVRVVANISPESAAAIEQLRGLTCLIAYSMPDESGRNPFWDAIGYPGPLAPPPPVEKTIKAYVPSDGETLTADVVVIGSGAGGGVIAAEVAAAGHEVVVLEAGGYFNEADFNQLEVWANQNLYYRGGFATTVDGNVGLLAGAALGGGTTVNWSNTVPPHPWVREEWARVHGLDGVDGPEFDEHLQAVMSRIKANEVCCDLNGPHLRMTQGAEKLGWHWHKALLNLDQDRYRPDMAAYTGYGDQTGAKQGTLRTYLQDAVDAGARILARTKARRVLVEGGQAVGVEATYDDPTTGARASVTVRARHVVVAGGALETPALLLRSGIGGPATGRHLRLHPVAPLGALYPDPQDWWWGPVHAAIVDEFADIERGHGFLVEGLHFNMGQLAAVVSGMTPAEHKEFLLQARRLVSLIPLVRDHGGGSVTIDDAGEAVHHYPFDDELDRRIWHDGLVAVARIHQAAGADSIHPIIAGMDPWQRGDDFDAFCAALRAVPIGKGGYYVGSAHQMGSARMGTDPADSVADPDGQLHDVRGVWIGDTSAFPTASGVNPMLSCMALARRTATRLVASLGSSTVGTAAVPLGAAD